MTRFLTTCVLLLALSPLAACSVATAPVRIEVRDAVTKQPLQGVVVDVTILNARNPASVDGYMSSFPADGRPSRTGPDGMVTVIAAVESPNQFTFSSPNFPPDSLFFEGHPALNAPSIWYLTPPDPAPSDPALGSPPVAHAEVRFYPVPH